MFHTEGDDVFYEIFPTLKGKTIKIYLNEVDGQFVESCKCFGRFFLEQKFDKEYNLTEENIKNNPNFTECSISTSRFLD